MASEVDIRILSVINALRPEEETQSNTAQFPQWFKLLSSCRKNTAVGMCGQDMLLDFNKNHALCAVSNYS